MRRGNKKWIRKEKGRGRSRKGEKWGSREPGSKDEMKNGYRAAGRHKAGKGGGLIC